MELVFLVGNIIVECEYTFNSFYILMSYLPILLHALTDILSRFDGLLIRPKLNSFLILISTNDE